VEFTSPALDFGGGSTLTFRVWADDVARVFLDSTELTSGFNPLQDTRCAHGPIGCETSESGSFSQFGTGDNHHIRVLVLQRVDTTPFGALVEGDLSAVPEPATILLLGSALAAAGVVSRKRFRKTDS
jgi:hypothetical protein